MEISGNDDKDKHLANIQLISLTFEVFHLEISGNENSEEQKKKHITHISNI